MARISGPYSAAFPVNFTSKGDTTRDAFQKHMNEIARIYGILTDFDKDVANAESISGSLTNHINSSNPHPNWTPSVSWGNVTNKPNIATLNSDGTLPASKVKGDLSNATIASGNVTGLEKFVNDKIPANSGDGITSKNLGTTGYVKFNNGFMLQWGNTGTIFDANETTKTVNFSVGFTSSCYKVFLVVKNSQGSKETDFDIHLVGVYKDHFDVLLQNMSGLDGPVTTLSVDYLAIGV